VRSGLVVVDKPAGWTSHDVVARLRGVYAQRRIGHAGTLDPDATGVLLVGLGRVTRLLRFLQATDKEYVGDVVLGVATDTLDAAGTVTATQAMPVTRAEFEAATRQFLGAIEQVPPMVSAVRIGGRRLHELARAGTEVDRPPRPVHIERIDVEGFVPGPHPVATIRVVCGSGTYIRSLAADLGAALGGPAHLGTLRRLRVGTFSEADAHPLDAVAADPGGVCLDPAVALRGLTPLPVDAPTATVVGHGSPLPADLVADGVPGPFAVLDPSGALLAVYERRGTRLAPAVVLGE
jgi:tRNA pseudouridine55 synthase